MGIEPARKSGGVVDAAAQAFRQVEEAQIGLQRLLAVGEQKTLLEVGHRRALLQAVIGGQHRAAGDAGNEVELVEQRRGAAAIVEPRFLKALQHAVGKRRGPGAAAGERHRDHGVVETRPAVDAELGRLLLRGGGQPRVDRIVVDGLGAAEDLSAADHEGGPSTDTPCANQTLELTPDH